MEENKGEATSEIGQLQLVSCYTALWEWHHVSDKLRRSPGFDFRRAQISSQESKAKNLHSTELRDYKIHNSSTWSLQLGTNFWDQIKLHVIDVLLTTKW